MIERQVIVTWEKPEDKLPGKFEFVIVTVSGDFGRIHYDHAFAIAEWCGEEEGWYFYDQLLQFNAEDVTVHAWADLEPYEGN